jgi:hypothetical protein
MSAALIGALGAIVGALIFGLATYYVDRRQKREQATPAANQILGELQLAIARLTGAVLARTWWESPLPDEAWNRNWGDLINELDGDVQVDREVKADVERAYGIINSLNGAKGSGAAPRFDEFAKNIAPLEEARGSLIAWQARQETLQKQRRFRYRSYVLIPTISVGVLLVALALIALLVNRPDVNQATVSSALQTKLGENTFVDCAPQSSNWLCTVHYLSASRSSCLTSDALGEEYGSQIAVIEAAFVTSCHDTREITTYIVEDTGGQLVAEPTAGEIERAILRGEVPSPTVVVPEPSSPEIEKAADSITGQPS